MRVLFAVCCLAGVVLGGALVPAVGIQTPVPDIGVDGDGEDDLDGGPEADADEADDAGDDETDSEDSEESDETDEPPGENSGTDGYGGVSAGGYPEETTIGGELGLSDHPELLIRAPEQSRWRLGSYSTYTGSGFQRAERDREVFTEPLPTADDDRPSPQYDIEVEPQRPMSTLATVWRPAFGDAGNREVFVDDGRALTVEEPIEEGETYVTVTYGPPSRAKAAERSGRGSYPSEIERRYTQLPDDTPQRLAEKTESIADDADAETPFETAQAVDAWLKTNKEYSLEASHDRSNDVADEFVFEMEAGYCQYFATAMTTMLRTQGVPARYVTGYGGGERVGDDEYLVRGKHAHAWVEVYIADVGWVTFDPTAAGGRLDADRDETPVDDLGEVPEEDEDEREQEDEKEQEDEEDERDVTDSVNVDLTPDPVPGREVTVTVTHEGTPISDATVRFNGDRVGETDGSGNVTAEVPYSRSLEIEVLIDGDRSQPDTGDAPDSQSLAGSVTRLDSGSRLEASDTAQGGLSADQTTPLADRNTTFSFDVPTEIEIELADEPIAGSTVGIEATIDDEPVRDGEVSLDNETVARTDDDGTATVELPDAETTHLVVERDEARGNRTLNLTQATTDVATDETSPLNLAVEPSLFVAMPGTTATLNVTHEDSPVPNATVAVDGTVVGETATDGTLDVSLPIAGSTTLTAAATIEGERSTATTTLSGMYQRLAAALTAVFVVLAAVFVFASRRGLTPRTVARMAGRLVTGTGRLLVASVVAFGRTLESAVGTAVRLANRAVQLLGNGINGAIELAAAIGAAAVAIGRRSAATIRSAPARLHPLAILAYLKELRRSAAESVAARRAARSGSDAGAATEHERVTVREAWNELRAHVTVRSWRTSTPGEVAKWAVKNDGLPADAVHTLRDAFRDVEYGGRSPERLAPDVENALETIRTSQPDEEGTGEQ